MTDLAREIIQTLRRNKLRTALTGLAVAWGIFMLIVLLGMARGVFNSFEEGMAGDRSSRLSVWPGLTSEAAKGYKDGRVISLSERDARLIEQRNSNYARTSIAYRSIPNTNIASLTDYVNSGLSGIYPEEQDLRKLEMAAGRFINESDISQRRKVMVIPRIHAKALFGGDGLTAVGQTVSAMGLGWKVVGVYDHNWTKNMYIPFSTAMMIGGDDNVSEIGVLLRNMNGKEDGDNATQEIRSTMASTHRFSPSDETAVYIYNHFTGYLQAKQGLGILNIAIWVIGIMTMLSGIVGVSNIMFVSVRERTHEIGIRRAIGAKPRSILLQIVTESVAITALFGYIGLFFGMCTMQIVDRMLSDSDFLSNPTVDLRIAVEVTLVLVVAGSLAGLFPALKATKVRPVEALRDE